MAPPNTRRPGFSRRAQYGLFFGYVVAGLGAVAGIVLLILSSSNPPAFAALRTSVGEITAPVSSALASVSRAGAAVPEAIGRLFRRQERKCAAAIDSDRAAPIADAREDARVR